MPLFRFEVVRLHESAEDDSHYQYSTVYLEGDGSNISGVNGDIAWLFALSHDNSEHYTAIESRVYAADEPPGAGPLDIRRASMNFFGPLAAPREMAIALHYEAGANTPRRRGRVYLSDWTWAAIADVPPLTLLLATMGLGQGLADVGGAAYTWVQWSRADGVATPVTRYWVNAHWSYLRTRRDVAYHVMVASV